MSNINEIGNSIVNAFQPTTLKNKILDGIKWTADNLGIKLVNGQWGDRQEGAACALGCMLLASDQNYDLEDQSRNEEKAAKLLGVNDAWVSGFICGFDAEARNENYDEDAYNLGTELRMELNVDNTVLAEDEDEDEEEEDYEEEDEDCDCDECLDEDDE